MSETQSESAREKPIKVNDSRCHKKSASVYPLADVSLASSFKVQCEEIFPAST
jgi:hypothetical protein